MEVWILRGTDPETLEEKINKQLEEIEKVKSLFHTPTVQYQTAVRFTSLAHWSRLQAR